MEEVLVDWVIAQAELQFAPTVDRLDDAQVATELAAARAPAGAGHRPRGAS